MKNYLLTPGPTPLPPEVCDAMARPIIHHRTPQFQSILKEAIEGLQYVFQTKNDVYILASSGTGAMEAAVCNLLSSGDCAITVESGKFGERWSELCNAYGINAEVIKSEWGKTVSPEEIASKLKANPKIKAVFTTLCETSTGVNADIEAIAKVTKDTEAALVVDAISGLAAVDLKTDAWGVDVVVCGSQKGLMLPPGLGFISVNEKAQKLIQESSSPCYYFDLKKAKKVFDKPDTPFTPAISLIIALNESLKLIKKEGLENLFNRFKKMAQATREAMKVLGLELLTDELCASYAVTAVRAPEGIDSAKLVKTMRDEYGVAFAGGQAHLKGKIFRIAHMGYITKDDLVVGMKCLETVLDKMGYKFQKGLGVKKLKELL